MTTTTTSERNGSPRPAPISPDSNAAPIQWRAADALRTHELEVPHRADIWCGRP